jgi:TRAP-type C4-dicarboxylate transport system permease small subunit
MKRLLAATEMTAAVFLLLIALLTASNVVIRYLFNTQIPDWFDGSRMIQGVALFWGFALATFYGSHICVDILWEHVGPQAKRWIDLLATAVMLGFTGLMGWMMWVKTLTTGTQGTMDLLIPLYWFYGAAALGGVVTALLCLLRWIRLWKGDTESLQP